MHLHLVHTQVTELVIKKEMNAFFIVADTKPVSIFGLEACENLKLIKRICGVKSKKDSFASEFADYFGEIGPSLKLTTSNL